MSHILAALNQSPSHNVFAQSSIPHPIPWIHVALLITSGYWGSPAELCIFHPIGNLSHYVFIQILSPCYLLSLAAHTVHKPEAAGENGSVAPASHSRKAWGFGWYRIWTLFGGIFCITGALLEEQPELGNSIFFSSSKTFQGKKKSRQKEKLISLFLKEFNFL